MPPIQLGDIGMNVIASRPIVVEWTEGPDEASCSAIVLRGTVGVVAGPVSEDGRWKVSVAWAQVLVTDPTTARIRSDYAVDVDPSDITVIR